MIRNRSDDGISWEDFHVGTARHGLCRMNSGQPSLDRDATLEAWAETNTVIISDWSIEKNVSRTLAGPEFRNDEGTLNSDAVHNVLIESSFTDNKGNPETRRAG
jgi:hypothetical protein